MSTISYLPKGDSDAINAGFSEYDEINKLKGKARLKHFILTKVIKSKNTMKQSVNNDTFRLGK